MTAPIRPNVSLKRLFPNAQLVACDDLECEGCDSHPESPMRNWVFAAGISSWSHPDQDVVTAINHGAIAILTEQLLPSSVPQCIVPDVRDAYAHLSMELAQRPCERLLTIGVVGTHGKTSSALMTASMLKRVGKHVAYCTSLGSSDGRSTGLASDCNQDSMLLAEWLKTCADNGVPSAVIELSDEMLQSHTTAALEFDVLVFTSMRKCQRSDSLQARGVENAKVALLDQLKPHGVVVYNADDARLNRWIARHQPNAIGYGLDADADVGGKRMGAMTGEQSIMVSAGTCIAPITSTLLGDHNARHMLSAIAVGYSFGLELYEIIPGIERLHRIPGRMQHVPNSGDLRIYVDAADQADRLAMALHALSRDGTPVTCVAEVPDVATPEQLSAFGRVLERAASHVILTQSRRSVRFGQRAIWQVLDGCEYPAAVQIVPNRHAAIELALRGAAPGSAVLLCGFGAETWTNDHNRTPVCDLDVATQLMGQAATAVEPAPVAAVLPSLRIFRGRVA